MNCENCNLNCNKSINYCPKVGKSLNNHKSCNLTKSESNICEKCNSEELNTSTYCSRCGNLLYNISNDYRFNDNKINFINKHYLKEKLIVVLSTLTLLGVVAFFAKLLALVINKGILSYLSIPNIILGFNLAPMEIISSNFMDVNKFNLSLGLIVCLVVPIICLSISINIFIKKHNNINAVKDSLYIGLIYGILLGLISIFSKKVINNNLDIFYTSSIIIKYKFIDVILNGTIIGSIISYINLIKYDKNPFTRIGIKSILTILSVYFIIVATLLISIYSGNILGYSKNLMSIISISQLGVYILALSSCIPIIIIKDIISIINTSDISAYLNEYVIILVYGSILINIMIVFICGYLTKYKFKNKKAIKIYSIYYAVFISSIIHISKIDILGSINILNISNYNQNMYIGGNIIVAFIIWYIYSYIISTLGYKLNKYQCNKGENTDV